MIRLIFAPILATLLALTTADSTPQPGAQVHGGWIQNAFFRPPVNVSRSSFPSRLPRTSPRSLVLDQAGPLYVLWVETVTHTKGVAHELGLCRYLIGAGWDSTATPVADWDGEPSTEPAAVIDRGHLLHVVWLEQGKARRVMGLVFDPIAGEVSDPISLSEPDRGAADPAIALDPEGRVHVVWSEVEGGHLVLRHRQAVRRRWGPVSTIPTGPGDGAFDPDLVCDADRTLHVVWTQSVAGVTAPAYLRLTPEGEWTEPERVADPRPGWFTGPPVVCAADARVWVVWAETDGTAGKVVVRSRTSDGWSLALSPSRRASVANEPSVAEQPSAAIDPWGTLHLVWLERRGQGSALATRGGASAADGGAEVVYSSSALQGRELATPRSLTAGRGAVESPMIAADASGRVLAAWVDRGIGSGDVVCRHGVAGFNAPAMAFRYR